MTPVRLGPAALRSRVKHSITEPLRSLCYNRYQEIRDLVSGEVLYGFVGICIEVIYRTHVAILSLSSDVHKDTVKSWQLNMLHPLMFMVFNFGMFFFFRQINKKISCFSTEKNTKSFYRRLVGFHCKFIQGHL